MQPSEWILVAVCAAIGLQRLAELRLAKRNEAWAREQGAKEFGAKHYPLFFVLHTGWLIAFPIEAIVRGVGLGPYWWAFLAVFVSAQGLRYWAIGTLGKRWNTRILILPDAAPIEAGPYRLVRHPNYVAVIAELVAVPLMFGATITALVVSVLNAILLFGIRIPAENRALGRG